MKKFIFFLMISVFCCPLPLHAVESMEGIAYFQEAEYLDSKKDYAGAFQRYLAAKEAGHFKSGMIIAERLRLGKGTERDLEEALEYYEEQADKENADAFFWQGWIYAQEDDEVKNDRKSFQAFQAAMKKGTTEDCYYYLYIAYSEGKGIAKNEQEALRVLGEGVRLGYPNCLQKMGDILRIGKPKKDLVKARELYLKAAEKGSSTAYGKLGEMYEAGEGGEPDIIKAAKCYYLSDSAEGFWRLGRLVEANEGMGKENSVVNCYRNAALAGHRQAKLALARIKLFEGDASYKEALVKAAEEGDPDAMLELGRVCEEGAVGVPRNYQTAKDWYEKAAAKGNREAALRRGLLAWHGKGMGKNETQAYEWFEKGMDTPEKQFLLAEGYRPDNAPANTLEKWLLPKHPFMARALKWYEQTAKAGNMEAQYFLGVYALQFEGKPEKAEYYDLAAYWFLQAANHGHSPAQARLGELFESGKAGAPQNMAQAYLMHNLASSGGVESSKKKLAEIEAEYPDAAAEGDKLTQVWLTKYPDCIDKTRQHITIRTLPPVN